MSARSASEPGEVPVLLVGARTPVGHLVTFGRSNGGPVQVYMIVSGQYVRVDLDVESLRAMI